MFDKDNLFLRLNVVFLNETACYIALTEQDKRRPEQTIQSGEQLVFGHRTFSMRPAKGRGATKACDGKRNHPEKGKRGSDA